MKGMSLVRVRYRADESQGAVLVQDIIAQNDCRPSSALLMALLGMEIHNDDIPLLKSYQYSFPSGSPTSTSCVFST